MRPYVGLLALISAACAFDPARHLAENDEEITIQPSGFMRGHERLDEEDFYDLIGDQQAANTVRGDRAFGAFVLEPGGMLLGVLGGGLAAAGGYVILQPTLQPHAKPLIANPTLATYGSYGAIGAGSLGVLGGFWMFSSGNFKAQSSNHFDQSYALASLEKNRYGTGGATSSTVASLALRTAAGTNTYCTIGGAALHELEAKDQKGRAIKITPERASWFEWSANPPSAMPQNGIVPSPVARSLADLGKDAIIGVKVQAPSTVSTTLDLKPDFGCRDRALGFSGAQGNIGAEGQNGSTGASGAPGSAGGNGGGGGDGGRATDVDVEATSITGPAGEALIVAAVQARGAPGFDIAVFDPKKAGPLHIVAIGGDGGAGGQGGPGGDGGSYTSDDPCNAGGPGAVGGGGGNGGRGGDGGIVHVRADAPAVLAAFSVHVDGGKGGASGNPGNGGIGGSGGACNNERGPTGAAGASGAAGAPGGDGRLGRVDGGVAPRASLRLLGAALATGGVAPASASSPAASKPTEEPQDQPVPKKKKKKH